jgi:hypothetical protein
MKSRRRRIDWLTVQAAGPCGWHQSVDLSCDDEMHPLLAAHTHRRVGSVYGGWRVGVELILHRVAASQGRSRWVRWHGQEASGATDAEAKRLGRRKSESAAFYAS